MVEVRDIENWLSDNDHGDYTRSAVEKIYDTFVENKEPLLNKLRKHPNWDENAMGIVLKESKYNRGFNKNAIRNFFAWASKEIRKVLAAMDKYDVVTELNQHLENTTKIITAYEGYMGRELRSQRMVCLIDGEPMIYPLKERLANLTKERDKYIKVEGYDVEKEQGEKYKKVCDALNIMRDAEDYLMTEELAKSINEIIDVKAVKGQKISKVIRKICCTVGLDKIKEINDYGTYTRDDGFNREFAMLCDQINPIEYKRITVISVNPLDYLSMSHGMKWTSCHYVGGNDDGCYSSGTLSYMLDGSSIIYYVIDKDYEGTEYYSQPKINRCVFSISEDGNTIMQSRVYPDGRDGGDDTLSGQFRTVMQKVVSDCYERNNYWDLKKGTGNCGQYVVSTGTHYKDYLHYEDCNISLNKDITDHAKIYVGHHPICPCCGEEHDNTEHIECESCYEGYDEECCYCGDGIDTNNDDYYYCEDNGNYYCCSECAERDGLHWCEDDGQFHTEDNCFQDDWTRDWYTGEPEVVTEDGMVYASYDNAYSDGYDRDWYTNDWYNTNDMYWCDDEQVYIHPDNGNYVKTDNGNYYTSEEEASDYGYVFCENEDVWIKEENAIYTEDDAYFTSEEAAKENGYTENEEGEWVKESEVA